MTGNTPYVRSLANINRKVVIMDQKDFCLWDVVAGKYLPELYTWEEAKMKANEFTVIRRVDEIEMGW